MIIDGEDFITTTREELDEEIEKLEIELAKEHNITCWPIRPELIRMIKSSEIIEDDKIARWHTLFCAIIGDDK